MASLREGGKIRRIRHELVLCRHAGSFFLKIGAAIFCFGHIIHMTLNAVKHIYSMKVLFHKYRSFLSLLQSADQYVEEVCGQIPSLAYDLVHATFSLLQLYFIFKYGNVIVNKNKPLARFVFAHCMSSCLSFWVYTLYNETLDAIVKKYFPKEIASEDCYSSGYDDGDTDGDHDHDDRQKRFLGNVSTNIIYIWTSCVNNDTSMGNNMRCVVST